MDISHLPASRYGGGAKAGGHALALEHALGTLTPTCCCSGIGMCERSLTVLIHRADKSGWLGLPRGDVQPVLLGRMD